jgi:hypothetical protein
MENKNFNKIRKIVKEAIEESFIGQHFFERLNDRIIKKDFLNVGFEIKGSVGKYKKVGKIRLTSSEKDDLLSNIELIKRTVFDNSKSFAIELINFKIQHEDVIFFDEDLDYQSEGKNLVVIDDDTQSNGDVIYVIIRENRAVTTYFGKSYVPQTVEKMRVDEILKIKDLKNF